MERKKIKLSVVLAKYLWPVYIDPFTAGRDMMANQLLARMMKK